MRNNTSWGQYFLHDISKRYLYSVGIENCGKGLVCCYARTETPSLLKAFQLCTDMEPLYEPTVSILDRQQSNFIGNC